MKKYILIWLAFLFLCFSTANAQSFVKGDAVIQLGAGIPNFSYANARSFIAPYVAVDCAIADGIAKGTIGVGGFLGFQPARYDFTILDQNYSHKHRNVVISARGTYHPDFANTDKFDAYIGLMAGMRLYSFRNDSGIGIATDNDTFFSWGLNLGGRYWFSPSFGAFLELGYGLTFLSGGLVAKF